MTEGDAAPPAFPPPAPVLLAIIPILKRPRETRPYSPAPSPLEGEGRGEGNARLSGPYTRNVLPVPTRREILHFVQNDKGEVQNDNGERNDRGVRMTTGREERL